MKNLLRLSGRASAVFILAIFGASVSHACIDVRVQPINRVQYNPLDGAPTLREFNIVFTATSACPDVQKNGLGAVQVAFEDSEAGDKRAGDVAFDITSQGRSVLTGLGEPDRFMTFDFGGQPVGSATFVLVIDRGQFGDGGYRQIDVKYRIPGAECPPVNCTDYDLYRTERLLINIHTLSVFSIGIAGSGPTRTIELGEIESGEESQRVIIEARATAPFKLVFESDNQRNLKLTPRGNGGDDEKIPYTAVLAGTDIDGRRAYTERGRFGTFGAMINLPFWIRIGDATGKRAGMYKDTVTVTIEPL